jgi:excisionase family DNA binding protein
VVPLQTLKVDSTNKKKVPPSPSGRPDAWRVNDALRQLSVSRATLYKMANNGEIRLARIGGRTLVPDAEIRRLVGEVA